jgi:ribosomal protein L37AE/L43A
MLWPFAGEEEKKQKLKKGFEKKVEKAREKEESSHVCSACSQAGADKRYAGLYWHRQCLRKARKMAKGII